nr:hypothetical protein [Arthrobacter terrae]
MAVSTLRPFPPCRFPQRADRIGNGFYPRQRGTAIGEGAQHDQDARPHHQPVALTHLNSAGQVPGVVLRQTAKEQLAQHADDDHGADHDREEIGGHREGRTSLAQTAEIDVAHQQDDGDGDFQAVGTQRPDGGHDRDGAGSRLDRDRHDVVDEQGGRRDLRHLGAEILSCHDVGSTGLGVDRQDLPVGGRHQNQDQQNNARDRQDQGEGGQARIREQLQEDFLGTVRRGGNGIGGKHTQGHRIAQLLRLQLRGDQRLTQKYALEHATYGLGHAARTDPVLLRRHGEASRHCRVGARFFRIPARVAPAHCPLAASTRCCRVSW